VSVRSWVSASALLVGAALAAAAFAACNVGFYQGPDRPDDPNVVGPPPPADFHCERGVRRSERVGDGGRSARVVHVLGSGAVICSTEDRNGDGVIDTWNLLENGRVVQQATDTDFNGTLDVLARDTKGDGTLQVVAPLAPSPPLGQPTPILPLRSRADAGPR
jgi:hypothetical protein